MFSKTSISSRVCISYIMAVCTYFASAFQQRLAMGALVTHMNSPKPLLMIHRWSKYGARYGKNQDDNGDNAGNGCGGDGGEYFWYMGQTQCFRPNVAYSLYGVLKGASHIGSFCKKSTYINSFFTSYGVESFGGPLGLDVETANSYCTTQEPEDGQSEYYVDEIDDDYLSSGAEFVNYQAYTSYGTGCSSGKFVTDKYTGAFCHGDRFTETLDTLDSFNSAIESLGCTQIYSRSSSGGRELENEDYNFAEMETVKILSFSTACDIRQYPQECPDPYGKKIEYTSNLERSFSTMALTSRSPVQTATNLLAILFALLGLLFMAMAYNVHRKAARLSKEAKRRRHLRRMKKEGNPQEASPPPSPPRETVGSAGSSEPSSDFWDISSSISQAAMILREKIRYFTEPQTTSPAAPNEAPSETPPQELKSVEVKTRRLSSFRRIFGRKK